MAKFKLSKFSIIASAAALIAAGAALHYINTTVPNVATFQQQTNNPAKTTANVSTSTDSQGNPPNYRPGTLNLPIPFSSQAPTGNWDLVHNQDCEEAVSVMANAYLTGNTSLVLPAAQMDAEMTNLNNWEDSHFGYHLDTTAAETAQMIRGFYGLKATVQNDYTLQDIKNQLNLHNVVILPEDGQLLGNPNYKQPGPIYHMLIIRGYASTGLITNDSGTRRGENYPYTFETLHDAGADWDHTTNTIDQSKKSHDYCFKINTVIATCSALLKIALSVAE